MTRRSTPTTPSDAPTDGTAAKQAADQQEGHRGEKGYVIATTALLLVPLMIFAAFATDVGAWYVRAQQIQRASDAAALAGVVWMPNVASAEHYALETIKVNGYPNAVIVDQATFDDDSDDPDPTPQVLVTRVGDQQLRVDLKAKGELYFGELVLDDGIGIARFAVSEYVLPVEFGSPTNFLGFGALELTPGNPVNAWTGMMGYCQPPHYGDVRAAYYYDSSGCKGGNWSWLKGTAADDQSRPIPTNNSATPTNPQHNPDGYYFVVDVPEGRANGTDVFLYDAPFCPINPGNVKPGKDTKGTYLQYTLWDATDTPLDDSDAVVFAGPFRPGQTPGNTNCMAWDNPTGWNIPIDLDPISGLDNNAGRWFVQVQNDEVTAGAYAGFGDGVNYFSIEARDFGAASSICYTYDPAPCVGVYARDQLPIRTQTTGDVANFFLANVEPIHDGKTLEIEMWDLGEGMSYVEILDPLGRPVPFTWETDDTAPPPEIMPPGEKPNENCDALSDPLPFTNHCLQVYQNNVAPKAGPPDWPNHGRFNGRWVTARVTLTDPLYFADALGTPHSNFWWQIRYVKTPTQNSADWTTWSTRVVGDPVRLVD